ncbi:MAG: hypothetical protein ABSF37_00620 [Sedimentisphaerales bacterium]|jgi:prepilin-type processing-associated H-X9-DG protein
MNANKGLTRIDAIIAVACVALVLAQAAVLNAGGRERSKLEVCLANLRSLAAAWQTYSSDNNSKVPCGDIYYSWIFPGIGATGPQLAWLEWPHPFPHSMPPTIATNYMNAYNLNSPAITQQAVWQHAIGEGTLWKYVGDYNIYRCPDAGKGQYVTYYMSHSMNTYPGSAGADAPTITNINQISNPAERFVFIDNGNLKQGAFYVVYDATSPNTNPPGRWYDLPPMIHSQGTTFSFADGHAIYRKWTDPHTLQAANCGWGQCPVDYCDCDLRWMVKVTWGSVPFNCTDPVKHCEY